MDRAMEAGIDDVGLGVLFGLDLGFQGKTFVSHILQGDDLFFDFFLGQFFSCDMLVLMVVRTVDTAVDAVIGKIQRK